MKYLESVLRGLIAGTLSAYLVLYGLRPAVPYPDIILDLFDNKWILLILLIINYYVFVWDYTCGVLFLLSIIALLFDLIIFTDNSFLKKYVNMDTTKSKEVFDNNAPVFLSS